MNNKKLYTILIIAICTLLCSCSIDVAKEYIANSFWNYIANKLNEEDAERQQKVENGEIVRGKDTVIIWENMFEIGHYSDGNHLSIKNEDYTFDTVIEKIENYTVSNEKLYIVSEEGFVVIDKSNLCRVYITVPDKEFVNGYSTDEDGEKHYISRYLVNEHIQYLSSFDEFSEEERMILNEMNN